MAEMNPRYRVKIELKLKGILLDIWQVVYAHSVEGASNAATTNVHTIGYDPEADLEVVAVERLFT